MHIDFLTVSDKPVKVKLPVVVEGTAEGVKKGGRLSQNFHKLLVLGKIEDMPETININVEKFDIGDGVKVQEMNIKGFKFLDTPTAMVVGVQTSRKVAEEEPAKDAAATPATPAAGAEAKPAEEKGKAKREKIILLPTVRKARQQRTPEECRAPLRKDGRGPLAPDRSDVYWDYVVDLCAWLPVADCASWLFA